MSLNAPQCSDEATRIFRSPAGYETKAPQSQWRRDHPLGVSEASRRCELIDGELLPRRSTGRASGPPSADASNPARRECVVLQRWSSTGAV